MTRASGGEDPPAALRAGALASAAELVARLRAGRLEPESVLAAHLARLAAQRDLNAFLWADEERLGEAARVADVAGRPLAGLPIALKDNVDTAGIPTTSGSLVDRDRIPDQDAAVWRRLRDRDGAILLGKTHMSEYAYRSHHPDLGWVRNPRNPARATGGSSSGSAAAVAAGIAPVAIGTDTGGSVRIPAAYCGIVGLKGTFGLIENDGIVPLSPSMDHVGVLARSVADAALVFERLAARPLRLVDPATLQVRPAEPASIRVGLEPGWFGTGAQPAVAERLAEAAAALAAAGCRIVETHLPDAGRWRVAHKRIILRDAWAGHADRLRAGAPYGPVFRAAATAGGEIADRDYERAIALRARATATMAAVFETVDVLLTPTCPTIAPAVEEGRRRTSYTRYTTLAAFTGLPAISIPAGSGALGLPVGAQLISGRDTEPTLVAVAALLEGLIADGLTGRATAGANGPHEG